MHCLHFTPPCLQGKSRHPCNEFWPALPMNRPRRPDPAAPPLCSTTAWLRTAPLLAWIRVFGNHSGDCSTNGEASCAAPRRRATKNTRRHKKASVGARLRLAAPPDRLFSCLLVFFVAIRFTVAATLSHSV